MRLTARSGHRALPRGAVERARRGAPESDSGHLRRSSATATCAASGPALEEDEGRSLSFHQPKNEQSMVHAAIGYARANNLLSTLACSASIGPGSTNLLTGAATATVNRVPVLLLPSDTFANRRQGPVMQALEHPLEADLTVNDAFRPLSAYFDRITRPEQLVTSLPEAMRVLLDPAETGAVTLSLHQDVQAEAYDFPPGLFEPHTWHVARRPPADSELRAARSGDPRQRAAAGDRRWRRPLLRRAGGARRAVGALRHPGGRDLRGQGRPPGRRARHGRSGRHGHPRGQRAGARGGPGDLRRDSAHRPHDRVAFPVPGPAGALPRHQPRVARRPQARCAPAGGGRQARAARPPRLRSRAGTGARPRRGANGRSRKGLAGSES